MKNRGQERERSPEGGEHRTVKNQKAIEWPKRLSRFSGKTAWRRSHASGASRTEATGGLPAMMRLVTASVGTSPEMTSPAD
jgi:hypothetical protein